MIYPTPGAFNYLTGLWEPRDPLPLHKDINASALSTGTDYPLVVTSGGILIRRIQLAVDPAADWTITYVPGGAFPAVDYVHGRGSVDWDFGQGLMVNLAGDWVLRTTASSATSFFGVFLYGTFADIGTPS